ncbi:8-oxoguanine deaminase [Phycisphaerae bacterium RAS1]|nr:8-oxoguanine deaminase [Phycisphaerae bacterium RAS1]
MPPSWIEADWTLIDGVFRPGVRIQIGDDGRIAAIEFASPDEERPAGGRSPSTGPSSDEGRSPERSASERSASERCAAARLHRRALLPGFVNVHSHAFQRALRGFGESYPAGMGDFWSWREAMYGLVERLDPPTFKRITLHAFREMLAAGITTVGEFHYVHHADIDAQDFALDELVIEAAKEAGIRLVLLLCFYKTGGVGKPLVGGQRRFATPDVERFVRQFERLEKLLDPRTQSIGLAPHSLRAVPPDDLKSLKAEADRRGVVCHTHIEEQRKEIEEVRAALGVSPLVWLLDNTPLGPRDTIIHATHSTPPDLRRYLASGAHIGVCPLTEGNLGDGIAEGGLIQQLGAGVCIGSDSNIRIDFAEELRWLEFVQRLRAEKRGVCKEADGELARRLWRCGTSNGAVSLGLDGIRRVHGSALPAAPVRVGEICVGAAADFLTIDLDAPTLDGWTSQTLLASWLLGAGRECVRDVCVAGAWTAPPAPGGSRDLFPNPPRQAAG